MDDTTQRRSSRYFSVLNLISSLLVSGWIGVPVYASDASPMNQCPKQIKDLTYSASFVYDSTPLKVRLGKGANKSEFIAQIWNKAGHCEAVCRVKVWDKITPGQPNSLDLDCASTNLGALTTPATIFWSIRTGQPAIRFGTWLNGYKQADLKVEVDHFNRPSVLAKRSFDEE